MVNRGSQFNTLEFMHKPECPLHELEAYGAQEGIWNGAHDNLMIQDGDTHAMLEMINNTNDGAD